MDVKVYMDSCMALNGSCFMVTWTTLKNHPLDVGLTQNQETMALRTLTTVGLFFFIMYEDLKSKIHCNSIWLRAQSYMTKHYTTLQCPWPHYMIAQVSWDWPLDTSFWALTIPWSQLLARVWSGSYVCFLGMSPYSSPHSLPCRVWQIIAITITITITSTYQGGTMTPWWPSILTIQGKNQVRALSLCLQALPMNGENRLLVTDAPVQFEK
jgi:hypothetical protein